MTIKKKQTSVFDELREYFRNKSPTAKQRRESKALSYRKEQIRAVALSLVYDGKSFSDPYPESSVSGVIFPTDNLISKYRMIGKAKALLREGAVTLPYPLNASFILGLKIGGGLRYGNNNNYYLPVHLRELIAEDFSEHGYYHQIRSKNGRWWLTSAASTECVSKPTNDTSMLAGIFSCMRYEEDYGLVPYSDFLSEILKKKSIPFEVMGEEIKLSPFYYALYAAAMPNALGSRFLDKKYPYLSAILAGTYWELLLKDEGYIMSSRLSLPYGCSRAMFYKHGFHVKDIDRYRQELGIFSIDNSIREMIAWWYAESKESTCEQELIISLAEKLRKGNGKYG